MLKLWKTSDDNHPITTWKYIWGPKMFIYSICDPCHMPIFGNRWPQTENNFPETFAQIWHGNMIIKRNQTNILVWMLII